MSDRVLQRAPGRTVVVEDGGTVVRKTFSGDAPEVLVALAEAEFGRLERLHAALQDVPGAGSPRPIEVRAGGVVVDLRMEWVPGDPLLELIRTRDLTPALVEALAGVAASAVTRYVGTVGEPYDDFQLDNMLYDDASGILTFVDLGPPDLDSSPPAGSTPLEVTLGNLIGSTMFQSARPKWALAARQHRQAIKLCTAIVVGAGRSGGVALSPHRLSGCARVAYQRSAFKGRTAARLWYSSAGYLLARRPQILGVTFRPPLRPPPAQPMGNPSNTVPGRTNKK